MILDIDVDTFNQVTYQNLLEILKKHEGDKNLLIKLKDEADSVVFSASKKKVNITKELLNELTIENGLTISLEC